MKTNKNKKIKELAYNFLIKLGLNFFYRAFPEYFAKKPLKPSDRYIEYPFVIQNLPKPPQKVLDVGCSGSFFPLLLASFGYETYGLDVREYAIINRIELDNFHFVKEDIRTTSFPRDYFDAITAISTLEHVGIDVRYDIDSDLQGDKKAIDEMKRILKPNGIILLTLPFGKAKIIKPYCKIYDDILIKQITRGLEIEKKEYYMQDLKDDWYKCLQEEAGFVDATSDKYPLCLLKIIKK